MKNTITIILIIISYIIIFFEFTCKFTTKNKQISLKYNGLLWVFLEWKYKKLKWINIKIKNIK